MDERTKDVYQDALTAAHGDKAAAADALCDEEYLANSGYTCDDQSAIEEAYERLKQ